MAKVLVDTSAVFALLDRDSSLHTVAKETLILLRKERTTPILTNFIVSECHALVLDRLGADVARTWLRNLRWPIERVTEADEERAREIIFGHADKTFSYTDATSFAVMERIDVDTAFCFDRHFQQFGLNMIPGKQP